MSCSSEGSPVMAGSVPLRQILAASVRRRRVGLRYGLRRQLDQRQRELLVKLFDGARRRSRACRTTSPSAERRPRDTPEARARSTAELAACQRRLCRPEIREEDVRRGLTGRRRRVRGREGAVHGAQAPVASRPGRTCTTAGPDRWWPRRRENLAVTDGPGDGSSQRGEQQFLDGHTKIALRPVQFAGQRAVQWRGDLRKIVCSRRRAGRLVVDHPQAVLLEVAAIEHAS